MRLPENVELHYFKEDPINEVKRYNKKTAIDFAKYLDYKYHSQNRSLVTDEQYDILKDYIAENWPRDPYLRAIGHKPSERTETVDLPVSMPSMDKLKPGDKKLSQFLANLRVAIISDKLDGISLLLEYKNGRLFRCYTRGDGKEGQDVSGIIPALRAPKTISVKTPLFVRCEFIIKKKNFSAYSVDKGGKYQTARNMGGGLLTHNQPNGQVRSFDVVAYEVSKGKNSGSPIATQLKFLEQLKFNVVRHKIVRSPTPEKIVATHNEFRNTSEYEIDGIIIDQNVSYRVASTNPKHAKAFKVNSLKDSKIVTVKEVEYRRSRLNRLVPRVIIDPINLGGVKVTYFTGHSYFYIKHGFTFQEYRQAQKEGKKLRTLPINRGARIRVIRSGDVIPYIMEVVKPARSPAEPNVEFELGPNNVHAIAIEDSSHEDEKKRITHFFSAMKIEGLKAGVVSKLYDAGFESIKDIIYAEYDELMEVDGIQSRMANNILKNIDAGFEKATFSTIGYASQQFDEAIGIKRLQAIVDMYPDFLEKAESKSVQQLTAMISKVPGIKTQAGLIAQGAKRFVQWLDDLELELEPEKKQEVESDKLDGLRVLFTGIRDVDLLDRIIANGGKKAGSVKSADVLVIKEGGKPNNKTRYAEENSIPMFTIDQFIAKYDV